jgi:DNA-binding NarL/FixJ family response regulator
MALRIFLVDDHEVVRRGVRNLLEADTTSKWSAKRARSGSPSQIAATAPDVAVLDVRLPMEAASNCAETSAPTTRLCLFDADLRRRRRGIVRRPCGRCRGYLLKQVKGTDIIAAIRQVGAGRSLLDPAVKDRSQNCPAEDPGWHA